MYSSCASLKRRASAEILQCTGSQRRKEEKRRTVGEGYGKNEAERRKITPKRTKTEEETKLKVSETEKQPFSFSLTTSLYTSSSFQFFLTTSFSLSSLSLPHSLSCLRPFKFLYLFFSFSNPTSFTYLLRLSFPSFRHPPCFSFTTNMLLFILLIYLFLLFHHHPHSCLLTLTFLHGDFSFICTSFHYTSFTPSSYSPHIPFIPPSTFLLFHVLGFSLTLGHSHPLLPCPMSCRIKYRFWCMLV